MVIKVMLVEDHELTRQGIAYGLKKYSNMSVVAEAEDGKQAINFADTYKPDVILMDVVMPIINGIDAAKIIKEKYPDTKILMLTSHSEREKVLAAFKSGADAYCMKNIKLDRLVQIIEMVNEGAVWLDPNIAGYILDLCSSEINSVRESDSDYNDFNLTNREKEILKLVSEGLSNKDIANQLSLSLYTVKNHVSSVIQKLAVDDRTQAAILALKKSLI